VHNHHGQMSTSTAMWTFDCSVCGLLSTQLDEGHHQQQWLPDSPALTLMALCFQWSEYLHRLCRKLQMKRTKSGWPTTRSATVFFLSLSATSAAPEVTEFDRLSMPVNADVDSLMWWAENKRLVSGSGICCRSLPRACVDQIARKTPWRDHCVSQRSLIVITVEHKCAFCI